MDTRMIAVDRIRIVEGHNARAEVGHVQELADSIRDVGLLQPLTVSPAGDGAYDLVAGERRLTAACLVGLAEVPCVVRELADREPGGGHGH